jgi:ankyrin repeat protein
MSSMGVASFYSSQQPAASGRREIQYDFPSSLPTEQWSVREYWNNAHIGNPLCADRNNRWVKEPPSSAYCDNVNSTIQITQESHSEVLSLFAECVGALVTSDCADYREIIFSHLDDLTIETHENELAKNVEKLTGSSRMDALFQLVRYSVFLSSNNLLPDSATENLVQWMTESGTQWILDLLLELKTPTTEIFGSNVLVSAAVLGLTDTIRSLIAKGVEVNAFAGETPQNIALQEAVRCHHPRIVQLLLDAGADPKLSVESGCSVLHDALAMSNSIEIVKMLIEKGADVNGPYDPDRYAGPVLVSAAKKSDPAMTRILLQSGARINEMRSGSTTALQVAAAKGNVDVAQALIDAGAEIDAPAGKTFAKARQAAAAAKDFVRLTTPIQRAALSGNVELVQMLVSERADVNACPWEQYKNKIHQCTNEPYDGDYPMTALQAAVYNHDAVLVRILLMADAVVDARGCGNTPLQIAAIQDDAKIVQILLKHGANFNAPASAVYGRTALQAAAESGRWGLVQQLLDAGADVNAVSSPTGGRTALQAAAEKGDIELAKMLLRAGADVNAGASPRGGRTCLQAAAERGHVEVVLMLLNEDADVNSPAATQSDGLTALQAALGLFSETCPYVSSGEDARTTILQALLDAGANVNAAPSPTGGVSALEAAIRSESSELARSLLERGADPNSHTDQTSALGEAVAQESIELVSLLIHAGADVNLYYGSRAPDRSARTALQEAARRGSIPLLRKLLDARAKLAVPSHQPCSQTALQSAVERDSITLVQFLIAKGANPNERATDCEHPVTTLQQALFKTPINIDIVSALIGAGANANEIAHPKAFRPLRLAAAKRSVEAVQILLKAGACTALTSEDKDTALQAAVVRQNADLIQILLDAGADVNGPAGTVYRRTALQAAAEDRNTDILELLLSHGADVNAPAGPPDGITALQGAAMVGRLKNVLILLKAGAQINAPPASSEGRMALDAAAESGRLDIVLLLLKNDDDPEGIDIRCERAAKLAASNGQCVIARILREHRTSSDSTR